MGSDHQSLLPSASSPERLHQISAFQGCESGCCCLPHIASRSLEQSAGRCAYRCLLYCLQFVLKAAAITLHRSSVMFYDGSQFLFESSLRSAYWSTSRFMGPRLGICATIV